MHCIIRLKKEGLHGCRVSSDVLSGESQLGGAACPESPGSRLLLGRHFVTESEASCPAVKLLLHCAYKYKITIRAECKIIDRHIPDLGFASYLTQTVSEEELLTCWQ